MAVEYLDLIYEMGQLQEEYDYYNLGILNRFYEDDFELTMIYRIGELALSTEPLNHHLKPTDPELIDRLVDVWSILLSYLTYFNYFKATLSLNQKLLDDHRKFINEWGLPYYLCNLIGLPNNGRLNAIITITEYFGYTIPEVYQEFTAKYEDKLAELKN